MRRMIAVASLAVLLTGCGSGEQPADDTLTVRDLADLEQSLWVRTEELTAECMRKQGFDYQPRAYEGAEVAGLARSPFDLGLTVEEAESSGFGIVDDLLAESGPEPAAPLPEPDASGSAQDARDLALNGGGGGDAPGCRAEAEVQAAAELSRDIQRVEGRLVAIGELIEADPRYQDLWGRWSRCMAENGIDATDMTGLTRRLARDARELLAPRPVEPPQQGGSNPVEAPSPAPPDPAAVAELRSREIVAATAAVGCLEPLRGLYEEIVTDAERSAGA